MSNNTRIANLEKLNAETASQHHWSAHAHQEMTPETIEALRSVIGGFVWVEWYDPRTISHAPWHSENRPEDLKPDVCYSVGMSDDLPDEMAILVRPHFVPDLFEDEEAWSAGEIVIPYSSIRSITTLIALGACPRIR